MMVNRSHSAWFLLGILLLTSTFCSADDWPQWRGPQRTNISRETGLLEQWPESGPPLVWEVSGLGDGISTVSIADGRVITLGEFDLKEYVWALDAKTGELLWVSLLGDSRGQNPLMRWLTQRPPTIDEDRVYAVSLLGELVCFDVETGRELWRRNYQRDFGGTHGVFGFSDCPVVTGDKLICTPGGVEGSVVALEKQTGKLLWSCRVPDSGVAAYSNGVVAELAGRRQFVTFLEKSLVGIDVESGELLWRKGGSIDRLWHPHTPLVVDPFVISVQGFRGGLTVAEIEETDGSLQVREVLDTDVRFLARYQDDTICVGDYLYESARGIFSCINWKTGEAIWQDRIRQRSAMTSAEDHLYLHGTDGTIQLVAYSPESFAIKSRFSLPDHSPQGGTSTPVIAGKRLYIRSDDKLFCYDIAKENGETTDGEPASVNLPLPSAHRVANYGEHDWPQWRGPNRDGTSPETGLLQSWPEDGPPLEMKIGGLGSGITSVAVVGNRIYTLSEREDNEYVIALDRTTGRRDWATVIGPASKQHRLMRWLSQRTPTVDGGHIYAITSGGRLACLNTTDGTFVWKSNYTQDYDAKRPVFGFCDYPLVDGDRLICTPGGKAASVVALNKKTGEEIWRTLLPAEPRSAYSATLQGEVDGLRFYVTFLGDGLYGLAADDGRLLWRYEGTSRSTANSHTPLRFDNHLFTSNGYGTGIALLKLSVSDKEMSVEEVYFERMGLDAFQDNTLPLGDDACLVDRSGAVFCLDRFTGEQLWVKRTAGGRGAMIFADGCLYRRSADGLVAMFNVDKQGLQLAGNFQLPGTERQAGATAPVISDGRLYLRDNDRLFCYDIRERTEEGLRVKPRIVSLTPPDNERVGREPRIPYPIYFPTPHDVVARMLKQADVDKDTTLVDLGSGDGRIVIAAAKQYEAQAIGYEIEDKLVEISRDQIEEENLGHLARIEDSDMYKADLSDADVVAVFLYPAVLEKLKPQFAKMKAGTRIVSHQFPIPGIKPEKDLMIKSEETGQEHRILLYQLPLKDQENE